MRTSSEKACAPMGKRAPGMRPGTWPGVVGPKGKAAGKKKFVPFKKKGKKKSGPKIQG